MSETSDVKVVMSKNMKDCCCYNLDDGLKCADCGGIKVKLKDLKVAGESPARELGNQLPSGRIFVTPTDDLGTIDLEPVEYDDRTFLYASIPLKGGDGKDYLQRIKIGRLVGKNNDVIKYSEAGKVFSQMVKGKKYELYIKEKQSVIDGRTVNYLEYEILE